MIDGDGMAYNKQVFADNLNLYLNSMGENQSDICKLCGVSSSTASGWCTGQIMPRMDKVEQLADHFGCRISDLVESRRIPEDDSLRFPYTVSEETLLQELISKCNTDINKIATEVTHLKDTDQKTLLTFSLRILNILDQGGKIVVAEDPAISHPGGPQASPAPQENKDTTPAADGQKTPPEDSTEGKQ